MRSSIRWTAGELIPLADRLRYMLIVRITLFAAIGLGATVATGLVGSVPAGTGAVLGGWAGISAIAEIVRRVSRRRGLPLFGATLIIDGVVLVGLSEVHSITNVRYLIFLHMVAVVLLASYRTGLKMAVWYTLLLYTVFFAGRQGTLGLRPPAPGMVARWDLGQLNVFVGAVWAVAVATAAFSSVNERELRRRRFDLEALAQLAVALERAADRQTIASTLLDGLAENFPVERLLLLTAGPRPGVLGQRGTTPDAAGLTRLDPRSAVLASQTERQTLLLRGLDPEADAWAGGLMGGAGNLILIPLFAEGGCVGVLVAEHSSRAGSRVERRLVSILERFASHAALALRNAALLEQMERMANTDGLTHIANRRTFEANLDKEMARSIRSGEPVSLVMLDIDYFKVLNDTWGHQKGDEVLREVAVALQAGSREFDTIARYGGEEFAVILPGTGPDAAWAGAQRLHRLVTEGVTSVPITVSLGVASAPMGAQTTQSLVKAADDALYQAKRAGRNRVSSADGGTERVGVSVSDGS
jgi:two-component system, cell cycle response regulator